MAIALEILSGVATDTASRIALVPSAILLRSPEIEERGSPSQPHAKGYLSNETFARTTSPQR